MLVKDLILLKIKIIFDNIDFIITKGDRYVQRSASGLVVKSNVAIVGPRVRFPAGAFCFAGLTYPKTLNMLFVRMCISRIVFFCGHRIVRYRTDTIKNVQTQYSSVYYITYVRMVLYHSHRWSPRLDKESF